MLNPTSAFALCLIAISARYFLVTGDWSISIKSTVTFCILNTTSDTCEVRRLYPKYAIIPTIRPATVVTIAVYIPPDSKVMSILPPACAILKNACTIPITVPKKPIIGAPPAMVAISGRPFSIEATSMFAVFSTAVENTANIEVASIEKGLPLMATIAGGAPMIGFLGTVMGMVQAFFNMAQAGGNIDITLLSGGIYTAMVTTVAGLIVGIMAYFGYNLLTSQVSDVVFKMQNVTVDFMDMLQSPVTRK